jgi:hypothetical protein
MARPPKTPTLDLNEAPAPVTEQANAPPAVTA